MSSRIPAKFTACRDEPGRGAEVIDHLGYRESPSVMQEAISRVVEATFSGVELSASAVNAAVGAIMDAQATEIEIASFLTALRSRPETVEMLVGAAQAMRARATPIPCQTRPVLDTCGTGGDGLGTFNISTAAAIVVAASGVPVAKHGNRSFSSKTGSADVLEALGVNVNLTPAQVAQCVDQIGIGFCFAPLLHGAMKHATPVRRQLGFRTIFNLLGPLTNPAGAHFQVVGTIRPAIAAVLAGALAQLGTTRAYVVCGAEQLDEVALWGTTDWWRVEQGTVTQGTWTLADLGLTGCSPAELQIDSPAASAAMITAAFGTQDSPAQRIILANAAAGLLAAGKCTTIGAGVTLARETVHSGGANRVLSQLVALSHQLTAANP